MKREVSAIHNGGAVTRYHTLPTVGKDTVASHSFGVAWIAALLFGGKPSAALLLYCLLHDLAELEFGDIPAPTKRALRMGMTFDQLEESHLVACGLPTPEISPEEQRAFKLADNLDGLRFCIEERNRGNLALIQCERNYRSYIHAMEPQGTELDVLAAIENLRIREN